MKIELDFTDIFFKVTAYLFRVYLVWPVLQNIKSTQAAWGHENMHYY